jgi:hypothetical protein
MRENKEIATGLFQALARVRWLWLRHEIGSARKWSSHVIPRGESAKDGPQEVGGGEGEKDKEGPQEVHPFLEQLEPRRLLYAGFAGIEPVPALDAPVRKTRHARRSRGGVDPQARRILPSSGSTIFSADRAKEQDLRLCCEDQGYPHFGRADRCRLHAV